MIESKSTKACKRNSMPIETCLFKLFDSHRCSCDKSSRPTKSYDLPPLSQHDTFNEFTSHDFYSVSGFWPDQFDEIVENMIFTRDKIVHEKKTRTCCDKKTPFFLLFRRWRKHDTCESVKIVLRRQRPWRTQMCYELFCLLKEHHERCDFVLDIVV